MITPRMRIYTVHIAPQKKNPYENPVFVEERFNLYAFLFHICWALYHRLWLVSFAVLMVLVGISLMEYKEMISPIGGTALQFAFYILLGYHANDLRRSKLKKQGHLVVDIVTGPSLVEAEQRFFDRYFPEGKLPQTPPPASFLRNDMPRNLA